MKVSDLTSEDIQYELLSIADNVGRIFYWEGRVFREINDDRLWGVYEQLLHSKNISELFKIGLIETWIPQDITLYGNAKILEHKKIDTMTWCAEWTPTMIWDAALVYVRCNALLAKENLMLKDGHPWNILFDYSTPVFIDFGSIEELKSNVGWFYEFRKYFLFPLWLRRYGGKVGRNFSKRYWKEHLDGIGLSISESLLGKMLPPKFIPLLRQYHRAVRSSDDARLPRFFSRLEQYLKSLKPNVHKQYWSHYIQMDAQNPNNIEKADIVENILKELDMDTLIDLGANKGFYSFLAESLGYKVISAEYEEYCVDQIYFHGKEQKFKVQPVLLDVLLPTPHTGYVAAIPPSTSRLKSDVSLALAVVHHVVINQHISFEHFAEMISAYTKEVAVVEFIPETDVHLSTWDVPPTYNRRNFIQAFDLGGFELINEYKLNNDRIIFVFKRNNSS